MIHFIRGLIRPPRWTLAFVFGAMLLETLMGLVAAVGAAASYLDSYSSESLAQAVAHDLRLRTYHHLQRLSLFRNAGDRG